MEQHLSSMEMFLRSIWQLKFGGKGKWKSPSKCKKKKGQCMHPKVSYAGEEQQTRAAVSLTDCQPQCCRNLYCKICTEIY